MEANLTFRELVHYLDLTSTDPVVRRLIHMINSEEGSIVDDLIEEGMDASSFTFYDDGGTYTPSQYITHLRRECDLMEQEMRIAQDDLEEVVEERDRLKTRSVAELLSSMEELVRRAKAEAYEAQRTQHKIEAENEDLKEKINVWSIMERN